MRRAGVLSWHSLRLPTRHLVRGTSAIRGLVFCLHVARQYCFLDILRVISYGGIQPNSLRPHHAFFRFPFARYLGVHKFMQPGTYVTDTFSVALHYATPARRKIFGSTNGPWEFSLLQNQALAMHVAGWPQTTFGPPTLRAC